MAAQNAYTSGDDASAEHLLPQDILASFDAVNVAGELEKQTLTGGPLPHPRR